MGEMVIMFSEKVFGEILNELNEHGDPLRSWGNGDDFREMATIY